MSSPALRPQAGPFQTPTATTRLRATAPNTSPSGNMMAKNRAPRTSARYCASIARTSRRRARRWAP